jgi:hypothetical protein
MSLSDTSKRKINVRETFREFVEHGFRQKLGALSNKQLSQGLTRFFVTEIHNPLKSFISGEDFDRGYVDAGRDLGVDFIHRDDHQVLILQTKYCSPKGGVEASDVTHFLSVLERLAQHERLQANSSLADTALDIDWAEDQFICKFIALGRLDGQAERLTTSQAVLPSVPGLADRVTFEFLDESELTEELRAARSIQKTGTEACELFAHEENGTRGPIIELDTDGRRSCILVIRASQIVERYKRDREALFTLNIRNYIGDTGTNKAIIRTARETPASSTRTMGFHALRQALTSTRRLAESRSLVFR